MIKEMIGKPYGADLQGQSKKYVCWHFCREVYKQLGLQLPQQRELSRIASPVVPCIVLFRASMHWHSGVVWPDGLHFIHVSPVDVLDPNPTEYVIRKDRLTAWPNRFLIEGYYAPPK